MVLPQKTSNITLRTFSHPPPYTPTPKKQKKTKENKTKYAKKPQNNNNSNEAKNTHKHTRKCTQYGSVSITEV